jgi:hypothetical protein
MRRALAALLVASTVGALVAMFACNAVTGIGDYDETCTGCLNARCAVPYKACVANPACRNVIPCFQACANDKTEDLETCTTRCVHDDPGPEGNAMLACIGASCLDWCYAGFGQAPLPTGDGGADVDATSTEAAIDAPSDAANDDAPTDASTDETLVDAASEARD